MVAPQPYRPEHDVLLVQLFFEWRTGCLFGDFALSFRRRFLRALDRTSDKTFEKFIESLFAVNRLYVNYPIELLNKDRESPAFDAAFWLLHKEEEHLTVDESAHRTGVRITHPHLANAIYELASWFPQEFQNEPQRRSYLEETILRSLAECKEPRDKTTVLWAIARLGDPTMEDPVRSRVGTETVAAVLRRVSARIWAARCSSAGRLTSSFGRTASEVSVRGIGGFSAQSRV